MNQKTPLQSKFLEKLVKETKIASLVVLLLFIQSSRALTATYYVSPTGGGSPASGTLADPWSIPYANQQLRAGDTARLLPGFYIDALIRPAASGTSNSRIIYRAHDMNAKPEFRSTRRRNPYLIDLINRDYITINGFRADGEAIYRSSKFNGWLRLSNSRYCIIENSVFEKSKGYYAVVITNNSQDNKLLNNVFSENGAWDKFDWGGVHGDSGSAMIIDATSRYNLVEGNLFRRSGHDLGIIEGTYNIIRGNLYDNDWGRYWGPDFQFKNGDVRYGDRVGNRTIEVRRGQYNLIEENVFMRAPESVDNKRNAMTSFSGKGHIIRKNIFTVGSYESMASTVRSGKQPPVSLTIYNNTYYRFNGPVWRFQAYDGTQAAPTNNLFKNNIAYKTHLSPFNTNSDAEFQFLSLTQFYGDQFLDNIITGNLIAVNSSAEDQNVYGQTGGLQSLDYYQSNNPSTFSNNIQQSPRFFNETYFSAFNGSVSDLLTESINIKVAVRSAFSLASNSPCIDRAEDLTTTTQSGSNARVIGVYDAGYFTNGFGVITGDLITVGSNSSLRVTNVNYDNNQVTVDRDISWSEGSAVNLNFNGSSPDIGAVEFAQ